MASTSLSPSPTQPLTRFLPFPRLPLELRNQIYSLAHPAPSIIHFSITSRLVRSSDEYEIYEIISIRMLCQSELLPFLLCSHESHDEMLFHYHKIAVEASIPEPISMENDVLQRDQGSIGCFTYLEKHAYIRPGLDIFLISADYLVDIWRLGGKMNLDCLTHIALDDAYIILQSSRDDDRRMAQQVYLYTRISKDCPALTQLTLLVQDRHSPDYSLLSMQKEKQNLRILHIREEIQEWNLRGLHRPFYDSFVNVDFRSRSMMLDERVTRIVKDFNRFMKTKEGDTWKKPSSETLRFWRNVEVVTGLLCVFDDGKDVEDPFFQTMFRSGKTMQAPRCWVGDLSAIVECLEDGTPGNRYTGLKQMFDGEWN